MVTSNSDLAHGRRLGILYEEPLACDFHPKLQDFGVGCSASLRACWIWRNMRVNL